MRRCLLCLLCLLSWVPLLVESATALRLLQSEQDNQISRTMNDALDARGVAQNAEQDDVVAMGNQAHVRSDLQAEPLS